MLLTRRRRRRQHDSIPDLLSVHIQPVLEAALLAALKVLNGDGSKLGVALVNVPVFINQSAIHEEEKL
jgi:hypothetical protein